MMERQGEAAAVISAQRAAAPGFVDQDAADFLMPPSDRLRDAPLAPPSLAVFRKFGGAVLRTRPDVDRTDPAGGRWSAHAPY
jgi:hypothetical protein